MPKATKFTTKNSRYANSAGASSVPGTASTRNHLGSTATQQKSTANLSKISEDEEDEDGNMLLAMLHAQQYRGAQL